MDLNTITAYRFAGSRGDLRLAPGERFVAGGTWMFSEPQLETTGLVDLTTMGWPSFEIGEWGLRIGATCTIAELAAMPAHDGWAAHPLFFQCASALLASFKVWNVATVGGNICRSFAAGAMISLAVTLGGVAIVWTPDGGERRVPVEELITGNGGNALLAGEVLRVGQRRQRVGDAVEHRRAALLGALELFPVRQDRGGVGGGDMLRAIELPPHALRARTAFRKIALAELGRSGAVLTGRVDDDGRTVFAITAATTRPAVLRYEGLPTGDAR